MRKPEEVAAELELVFHPELFESRAWIRITNGIGWPDYCPLVAELEEFPRDNREGTTKAQIIKVVESRKGRTGPRGPHQVYVSLNEAMKQHGRAVRSSLETGKFSAKVKAKRIVATQSDPHSRE